MNDEIRSLIDSIRRGQYEDPAEKISVLAAALLEHNADTALLALLLGAPQIPLRLAALEACCQRRNPELYPNLARLATDSDSRVRCRLAQVLAGLPPEASFEPLKILVADTDPSVRTEAIKATAGKPAFLEILKDLLRNDPSWMVRHAAAASLGEAPGAAGAPELLNALAHDDDGDVRQRCADLLEKGLAQHGTVAISQLPTEISLLGQAERKATEMGGRLPKLLEWLRSHTTIAVNPAELSRFGTDLTGQAAAGTLPRACLLYTSPSPRDS